VQIRVRGQHLSQQAGGTALRAQAARGQDPRWSFAAGNKIGTIKQARGTSTGVAFGAFPATTDDDFNIATITLKALAPGLGTPALTSGQFIGVVGDSAGKQISPALGQATVTVVAEPQQWTLLLAGLRLVGVVRRKPQAAASRPSRRLVCEARSTKQGCHSVR